MRARTWIRTCLLGWFLLVGASDARASMVQALELAELTDAADLVVVGRVIKQWSHYDQAGRIVTDVQVQVSEVAKGSAAPGESIIVRSLGGVLEGIGMRVEGEATFEDGEEVLLFGSRKQGRVELRPVGMSQGTLQVYEQAGKRWVRSASGGLALVNKGSGGSQAGAAALAEPRPLDEVMAEVRRRTATSKSTR